MFFIALNTIGHATFNSHEFCYTPDFSTKTYIHWCHFCTWWDLRLLGQCLAYILFPAHICWMSNCIMQNNSRNYSGISHAHFLHCNYGCLVSEFIFLPRNDTIKQVTFWGRNDSTSPLLPASLPASLSTHPLSSCFRKLFNPSLWPPSPDRGKEKRKRSMRH